MNTGRLGDLIEVTRLRLNAEQAQMRRVLDRERELRQALSENDDRRRGAAALPDAVLDPARRIGGDILWHAWLSRNRTELNQQLALCLARKARIAGRLREAHGRHIAAARLVESSEKAFRLQRATRQTVALDHLVFLQTGQT